jgi:DNA-binding CsgD family transcriptional regulator
VEEAEPLLSGEDAGAMIALLSATAVVEGGIRAQKQFLMEGICRMIGAQVWMWACSRVTPPGKVIGFNFIDGGYTFAEQRSLALISFSADSVTQRTSAQMVLEGKLPFTRTRRQFLSDEDWYGGEHYKRFHAPTGLDDSLLSLHSMGPDGLTGGIGFHRLAGQGYFSERDRYLVHLITSEVGWLHEQETIPQAAELAHSLTTREHHVLLLLLAGNSRKQIALRMGISEHTVNHHMKQIHQHFKVASAGELMAKFINATGGSPGSSGRVDGL